jgi:hypothetical protein
MPAMTDLNIAWWNLENLFDAETAQRDPELKAKLRSELRGWTAAVRDKKIAQLASVIHLMFDGAGPCLLGVCEVENEAVLERLAAATELPHRHYTVVSHPSHDARGIDVSFIVDTNELTVVSTHHQVVVKRNATRDIFWARLRVNATGAEFVALGNHWPARSAGQYISEPFRMLTGETHAYIVSRLLAEDLGGDKNLPILSMGDYNDEPYNRAMQEYLLGTRDPGRVRYSRSGHMLNLMWPLMRGQDPGSYLFGSDWYMFDQFLVSYGLLRGPSPIRVDRASVAIFRPAAMRGTSGRPRRFGRPAKSGADEDGFSDHYPITLVLNCD